jgi:hypothetical protein
MPYIRREDAICFNQNDEPVQKSVIFALALAVSRPRAAKHAFLELASLLQKSVTFATGPCGFSPYGLQNCIFQRLLLQN